MYQCWIYQWFMVAVLVVTKSYQTHDFSLKCTSKPGSTTFECKQRILIEIKYFFQDFNMSIRAWMVYANYNGYEDVFIPVV